MKNIISLFALLVTVVACQNVDKSKGGSEAGSLPPKGADRVSSLIDSLQKEKGDAYLLKYSNDTFLQTIKVKYIDKSNIDFTLTTFNLLTNGKATVSGSAAMEKRTGDLESDQDKDGMAFFYDDWYYINKECQLYMRISDSANDIRILESDCDDLHNKECPFEINGVLRRVD